MAQFSQRPDGMLDVTLDDGSTLPMALTVDQAVNAGLTPATPAQAQPELYAAPGVPDPSIGLPEGAVAGPEASGARVIPPQLQKREINLPEQVVGPEPKAAPVPMTAPGGPTAGVSSTPPAEAQAQQYGKAVMNEELSGSSAPSGKPQMVLAGVQREGLAAGRRPEDEEALADARIDLAAAKLKQADQSEQALGQQARLQSEQLKQENFEIEQERKRQGNIERDYQERLSAIDARLTQARELDAKGTARERVWANKGWFGRILASFAIALGHLGTAQGGPNLAKQLLDEEVADEEKRHTDLLESAPERSALKQLMEVHQDEQAARAELRLRLKEQALSQAQYWATRAQGSAIAPQFDEWLAQLGLEIAQERDGLNRLVAGKVAETYKRVTPGGGKRPATLYEAAKKGGEAAESMRKLYGVEKGEDWTAVQERQRGRMVRYGDKWYPTANETEANETKTFLDAADALEHDLGEIERLVKENPLTHEVRPSVRGRINTLAGNNRANLAIVQRLRQLTKDEAGRVEPLAGYEANDFLTFDSKVKAQLNETKRTVRAARDRALKRLSENIELTEPVRPQPPPTRKGP